MIICVCFLFVLLDLVFGCLVSRLCVLCVSVGSVGCFRLYLISVVFFLAGFAGSGFGCLVRF